MLKLLACIFISKPKYLQKFTCRDIQTIHQELSHTNISKEYLATLERLGCDKTPLKTISDWLSFVRQVTMTVTSDSNFQAEQKREEYYFPKESAARLYINRSEYVIHMALCAVDVSFPQLQECERYGWV